MAVISYKCPNCDGELVFDPATQEYLCEYCVSRFSQQELEQIQPDTAGERPAQETEQEAVLYSCPSCGAEIVTDSTTAATFCYYCHNPVTLSGRLSGKYLPDYVVPFSVDKKNAEKSFLDYLHSKKFVPSAFFRKQQIEKLSGVYFPYWVYECTLDGELNAQGTNIRVWRSGETEYTETKYYSIQRAGQVELSGITKNALQKANQKLASGVLPYDLTKMTEFRMTYLSGFLAERRDLEKDILEAETDRETKGYGVQLLRDTISGYSSVTVNQNNLKKIAEKWSYVLLPVWTLTYKGRDGKMYYYSMNGQTGKVYGELPVDYKKIAVVGGIVALSVLILFLIGGILL